MHKRYPHTAEINRLGGFSESNAKGHIPLILKEYMGGSKLMFFIDYVICAVSLTALIIL